MTERWTEADIPDQTGRTVLVTGANSGLGLRTAEVLASKGARVLLACRSAERGAKALDIVKTAAAGAEPELIPLDLSELASVRAAAASARELTGDALDILVNNAGVMATARGRTADGFELQFGTNYLGHAALTWLLMPALGRARVVTLSSLAATGARIHLDDPNGDHRRYNAAAAYGQSKLADQVFALELDRRLRAAGSEVISVAAHPGYTATGSRQRHGSVVLEPGGALADRRRPPRRRDAVRPEHPRRRPPAAVRGDGGRRRRRRATSAPAASATCADTRLACRRWPPRAASRWGPRCGS